MALNYELTDADIAKFREEIKELFDNNILDRISDIYSARDQAAHEYSLYRKKNVTKFLRSRPSKTLGDDVNWDELTGQEKEEWKSVWESNIRKYGAMIKELAGEYEKQLEEVGEGKMKAPLIETINALYDDYDTYLGHVIEPEKYKFDESTKNLKNIIKESFKSIFKEAYFEEGKLGKYYIKDTDFNKKTFPDLVGKFIDVEPPLGAEYDIVSKKISEDYFDDDYYGDDYKTARELIKDLPEKKRKMIVLVGPPSVGKSTWIKSNFPDAYIINRDDIVEDVSSSYGWTYDDMFATPPADAQVGDFDEKYGNVVEAPSWMTWAKTIFDKVQEANGKVQQLMNSRVSGAHPSGLDIVVDMTNMNAGSRKSAMKAIEGNEGKYHKVAVDFKFKGAEDVIKKMAEKRAEAAKRMGKSKTIPPAAFDRMFSSYEEPTTSEGFDEILSVDNIESLKQNLDESIILKKVVSESIKKII